MNSPQYPATPQDLADRYAAVWNEADPAARRNEIAALWCADGEHYVRAREVRGYCELEKRVTGAYEKWVRDLGHRFRAVQNAQILRNVVVFNWEMFAADGKVLSTGVEFLVLDENGSIAVDYQFIAA
jgi:hypothetical protein